MVWSARTAAAFLVTSSLTKGLRSNKPKIEKFDTTACPRLKAKVSILAWKLWYYCKPRIEGRAFNFWLEIMDTIAEKKRAKHVLPHVDALHPLALIFHVFRKTSFLQDFVRHASGLSVSLARQFWNKRRDHLLRRHHRKIHRMITCWPHHRKVYRPPRHSPIPEYQDSHLVMVSRVCVSLAQNKLCLAVHLKTHKMDIAYRLPGHRMEAYRSTSPAWTWPCRAPWIPCQSRGSSPEPS